MATSKLVFETKQAMTLCFDKKFYSSFDRVLPIIGWGMWGWVCVLVSFDSPVVSFVTPSPQEHLKASLLHVQNGTFIC